MKITSQVAWAAAVTAVLVLAGCSSGGESAAPEPTAAPTAVAPTPTAEGTADALTIAIEFDTYKGASSVPAGTTITVNNMDSRNHTLTSDDGTSFDVVVQGGTDS